MLATAQGLDALIAQAAIAGQVLAGAPPAWIHRHAPGLSHIKAKTAEKARPWTLEEDTLVREQLGHLSYEELGEALGRSALGVKVHAVRLGLPGPSQHPDFISAHRLGELLEICPKRIARYIDEGILPGRAITPVNGNRIVHRPALKRWLVNPWNWVYFQVDRIQDPHLKRLIELRRERLEDDWWTTRQVADHHGVDATDVKRYIRMRRIPARQVKFPGNRWGYWYVRRSVATDPSLQFYRRGETPTSWSSALDDFLVLGAAIGLDPASLGRRCSRDSKAIDARLRALKALAEFPAKVARLGVRFDPASGLLFAPWQDHVDRFPALARAIERVRDDRALPRDLSQVRGLLYTWTRWHARAAPYLKASYNHFRYPGRSPASRLEKGYGLLKSLGLDPLASGFKPQTNHSQPKKGRLAMKLQIDQETLHAGLQVTGRAANARSTLPVLANVLMEAGGNLRLSATNLRLGITCWLPATIKAEGATTLPADTLGALVAGLPGGPLKLSLSPKTETLTLQDATSNARVKGILATEFPPNSTPDTAQSFQIAADLLKALIHKTAFAASRDEGRPVLTGVRFQFEGDQLTLAAADGFRLSIQTDTLPEPVGEPVSVIVPATSLKELVAVLPGTGAVSVQVSEKQITFRAEHLEGPLDALEVVALLLEGKFPDFSQVIPKSHETRVVVPRQALLVACRQGQIFARDSAHIGRFAIQPDAKSGTGQIVVRGRSDETGENRTTVDAEVDGPGLEIAFNIFFLQEALQTLRTPNVVLEFTTPNKPVVLREPEEDGFLHVLMPMAS